MLYKIRRGEINPTIDQYIIGTPKNPPFLANKVLEGIEYYLHKGKPIIPKEELVDKPLNQRFYYALKWNLISNNVQIYTLTERELVDAIILFMENDYFGQSPSHFQFEKIENKRRLKQYLKEKGKDFII